MPGRRGPLCVGAAMLTYDDPRVRSLLANQLMRELHEQTVVDLDAELAAFTAPSPPTSGTSTSSSHA